MAAICEYKYATIVVLREGRVGGGDETVGNGVMCGVIVAIKLLRIRLGYGRVENDRNPA